MVANIDKNVLKYPVHIFKSIRFVKYRSNKLQPRLSASETRNRIVRMQKAYQKPILRHSAIRRQRKICYGNAYRKERKVQEKG